MILSALTKKGSEIVLMDVLTMGATLLLISLSQKWSRKDWWRSLPKAVAARTQSGLAT